MPTGFFVPREHSGVKRAHGRKRGVTTHLDGIARVSHVAKAKVIDDMNHSLISGNTDSFKKSLASAITIFSREARVSDIQIKSLYRAISAIQLDQGQNDLIMLTTGDVAKKLGVSNQAIINWIETGKIKAFQTPGGHYRIPADQFRTTDEEDATSEAIFEKLWTKRTGMPPIDEDNDLWDL